MTASAIGIQTTSAKLFECQLNVTHLRQRDSRLLMAFAFRRGEQVRENKFVFFL